MVKQTGRGQPDNRAKGQRQYVVVGAGVLGAALADRLAAAGARVTVLDQQRTLPGEVTSRYSFAWYNANAKTPRRYHALNAAGMRAWAAIARTLDGGAWYRPVGNLEWTNDAERQAELTARVRRLQEWGYGARLVTRSEVEQLEPRLRVPERVSTAAWFPDEGYLLTTEVIPRLLRRAAGCGAEVRSSAAGRVVGLARRGRRWVVRTGTGERVEADHVVCCAGSWTPELARMAGVQLPLVDPQVAGSPAPGLVAHAGQLPTPLGRVVHTPTVNLRPLGTNGVHLEAADVDAALRTEPAVLDHGAQTLLERARAVVPTLREAEVTRSQVCVRPLPVDGYPIVGTPRDAAGLYLVVTHSGVTLSAYLAKLVAREVLGGVPVPELADYRPDRFADNEPLAG